MDNAINECIPKCGSCGGILPKQRKPLWWNEKALAKIKRKDKLIKDLCRLEKAKIIMSM